MTEPLQQSSAWQFALDCYAEKAVAQQCIELQDQFGCNVNLILLLHYLTEQGYGLRSGSIVLLLKAIAKSEVQLQQHRANRRQAKGKDTVAYAALLQQELELEHAQHRQLIHTANQLLCDTENTRDHVSEYLLYCAVDEQKMTRFLQQIKGEGKD